MIPFDELVHALERYKRRQAGEAVSEPAAPAAQQPSRGARPSAQRGEPSVEFALDDVEEA